uniref:hypothetical protein n=1 Tax=Trichocoleus desertorum TaxID=1481672 RepID=UPI0025B35539|nr:hypothetical protein [Trichocoleus desertorum]
MSYRPVSRGFVVIDPNGMPLLEASQQGRYALVFLSQADVIRYRERVTEVRKAAKQDYAIAAMPMHRIQRLLNQEEVGFCVIQNWDAVAA